jgi:hypothetical protein
MANAFFDQTLDMNFQNNVTVGGTLTVTGTQTFTGNQAITGSLTVGTGVTITAGALNHDGTTVGFYGATPTAQADLPAALHATLTQAGSDTGDVAIQAATNTTPYGFVVAAEFEAVVATVIANAATLADIRTALINIGIVAAA